jgi:hypothetical protein
VQVRNPLARDQICQMSVHAGEDAADPAFLPSERSGIDSGNLLIPELSAALQAAGVATFVLTHTHKAAECATSIASWKGFDSPLRQGRPLGSCAHGGHRVWWVVQAATEEAALSQLPYFVAQRTVAEAVREVPLP